LWTNYDPYTEANSRSYKTAIITAFFPAIVLSTSKTLSSAGNDSFDTTISTASARTYGTSFGKAIIKAVPAALLPAFSAAN
jgi:hypothetical protein